MMTHDEIIVRANEAMHMLQSRLNPSNSPLTNNVKFVWVCTQDFLRYIYSAASSDIVVSEDFLDWSGRRQIRYRGLPLRVMTNMMTRNEPAGNDDLLFPAIRIDDEQEPMYSERFYLDWFPRGTKVLSGDYLLEVMECGRHNSLCTIGMVINEEDYTLMLDRDVNSALSSYDNETYISSTYAWPETRGIDWASAGDWSRTYDLTVDDLRAALAREDARQWMRQDLGKFTHERRAPELDDDFESPDLSILLGDAMPKE